MLTTITKEVFEYINHSRLSHFLRENGLKVSGTKPELIDRIINHVNNPDVSVGMEDLDQFLIEEISNGNNRILFISSFPVISKHPLTDVKLVKQALANYGLPSENFNNLKNVASPDELETVYLKISTDGNEKVKLIELCFAQKIVLEERFDEEGEKLPPITDIEFIWCEINPEEQKFTTKMRQKSSNHMVNNSKTKETYDYISTMIREAFALAPKNMEYVKNVFYNIFKDLTDTAEKPFRKKVEPYHEKIEEIANDLANNVGLQDSYDPINLPHRLIRLLERALIQQDFTEYEGFFQGKKGIVKRIYFSDATGASVNARSSEVEEGIAVADIYFDTRESIEKQKMFDKIWVSWFYEIEDGKVERIKTKFEAYKEHFIIHFLYRYTTKGEQDHVLSLFEQYEKDL